MIYLTFYYHLVHITIRCFSRYNFPSLVSIKQINYSHWLLTGTLTSYWYTERITLSYPLLFSEDAGNPRLTFHLKRTPDKTWKGALIRRVPTSCNFSVEHLRDLPLGLFNISLHSQLVQHLQRTLSFHTVWSWNTAYRGVGDYYS